MGTNEANADHICPLLPIYNVIKGNIFPSSLCKMLQQERKKKCFGWKKTYTSPNKFYFILFFNIQQYPQTVYLRLAPSEVLALE